MRPYLNASDVVTVQVYQSVGASLDGRPNFRIERGH